MITKQLTLVLTFTLLSSLQADVSSLIWDDKPAEKWDQAYPVGNGRLGAMPWATFPKEKILINEETIWENKEEMKIGEDAAEQLEVIRQLVAEGRYIEADRHFEKRVQDGKRPNSYQLVGWLDLEYLDAAELESSYRELDLDTGIATNRYTLADGNVITQQVYASAPDDVILVEVETAEPIALKVSMEGATVDGQDLVLSHAASGPMGTKFVSRVRALDAKHTSTSVGNTLTFTKQKKIMLLLSVATNLDRSQPGIPLAEGWQKQALLDLKAAARKPLQELRDAAIADHKKYYQRVDVDFGATSDAILSLPTGERLHRIKSGKHDDPDLIETYYQFGHSMSRPSSPTLGW